MARIGGRGRRSRRGLAYLAVGLTVASGWASPSPVPAQELQRHTVMADGHGLAVWEKAAPDPSAVLLFVHGRTWSTVPDFDLQVPGEELSLMDGMVAQGFTTYGVDLRGYGETPRDRSGWNTPDRAARDVADVLRWIRARHADTAVHLFGWSLGSMVSQLVAQRNPELLERLVLFGYPNRLGVERPVDRPTSEPPRQPTTAEAAASDFIVDGAISERAVQAYVEAALEADPVRTDWTHGHEWNELAPERVRSPTLVIHGEHDPLAPLSEQEALFTGLGTTDRAWVVVPGGAHAAFLETPRPYFIASLTAFLLREPR